MKYRYCEHRDTLLGLYAEIRINAVRVNNAFCKIKMEERGDWCPDLFSLFDSPSLDLGDIPELIVCVEGLPECMEDAPLGEHYHALLAYSRKLETEMAKLPNV